MYITGIHIRVSVTFGCPHANEEQICIKEEKNNGMFIDVVVVVGCRLGSRSRSLHTKMGM